MGSCLLTTDKRRVAQRNRGEPLSKNRKNSVVLCVTNKMQKKGGMGNRLKSCVFICDNQCNLWI